jgi:hypothetical protein
VENGNNSTRATSAKPVPEIRRVLVASSIMARTLIRLRPRKSVAGLPICFTRLHVGPIYFLGKSAVTTMRKPQPSGPRSDS